MNYRSCSTLARHEYYLAQNHNKSVIAHAGAPRDPVGLAKADPLPQFVQSSHRPSHRKIGGYVFHGVQFECWRLFEHRSVKRSTNKARAGQHEEHAEITTSAWQSVGCTVHGYAYGENKNKNKASPLVGYFSLLDQPASSHSDRVDNSFDHLVPHSAYERITSTFE